jgi:tripeptide aminopeptidase
MLRFFRLAVLTVLVVLLAVSLPVIGSAQVQSDLLDNAMTEKMVQRFLEYTKYEAASDESSNTFPSTPGQKVLAEKLVNELTELGLTDITMDENGYVMATLPSNTDHVVPTIGFIAHLDTSSDASGANVNARVVRNYDGKDIVLNKEKKTVLSTAVFPEIKAYVGQDIIVTDGTTLLGADDRAGICAIMTALEYLKNHLEIKHGTIKIAFTPDEEIGRGPDKFDTKKFGVQYAYTVDGGAIGELEYETFNAAAAAIVIKGISVHPGYAKNKMINSSQLAMEFNSMLPTAETPAHTEGYEGYYHMTSVEGNVGQTTLKYIIRDHNKAKFSERKKRLEKITAYLNEKYGPGTFTLTLKDQYYNMREKIEPHMFVVDIAKEAIQQVGVVPIIVPVRGGTDGARLSYMGIPTPNIFAGGHNFHGPYEYLPVKSLGKAAEVVVKITEISAKR